MTLREYGRTPKTVLPQELVDGVLRVADAPFVGHQRIVFRLARALQDHVERTAAGEVFVAPVDVVLDADRPLVLQPDLLFVSQERSKLVQDRIYGAPDIVVEVLSPNPRIGRLDDRVRWFAQYGVREVWIYREPDRRLDLLTCQAGRPLGTVSFGPSAFLRSGVLPEFQRATRSILN
jgi:Uma2 family endonuclease